MATSPSTPAYTLGPADGESLPVLGGTIRILAEGATTAGLLCVVEVPVQPGDGPPLHRHEREDELFYVLEGRFKFVVDGAEFIAERGAFAFAPKASIHTYRNIGDGEGKLHVTCSPAGIEHAFRATRLPDPNSGKPPLEMSELVAIFASHGITFHGPPLAN